MSEYFFISKKITELQVKNIIKTASFDPTLYTYAALVDHDGFEVDNGPVMAISSLKKAAKDLNITVEITSGPDLSSSASNGGAGNGHGRIAAVAGTDYSIDFINDTPSTWTFSVYQTLPASPGLKSVSWKQTTVPKGGESGVQWSIEYLVAILNYKQTNGKGVYKASQKLGTQLGAAWNAVYQDGTQQLAEAGNASPGQVIINNKSGQLADLGIGMDGDVALVQPAVFSGAAANFEVEPTYWVAMYKDIVKGEVISGAQFAGPLKVKFLNGATTLTYRCWLEGDVLNFALADGSAEAFRAPLEQAAMRAQLMHDRAALALTL